jgi:hypothetical protein
MSLTKAENKYRVSTLAPLAVVTAVAVALVGGQIAAVAGSTVTKISACQNKKTGAVRIVKATAKCPSTELAVSWNVAGAAGPKGDTGARGAQGFAGTGAYETWAADPRNSGKTLNDFYAALTLVGPQGPAGADGIDGEQGERGLQGDQGAVGPGLYETWAADPANDGKTLADFYSELTVPGLIGPEGPQGPQGQSGADGVNGQNGADGIPGLPGADGKDGKDGTNGTNGQRGAAGLGVFETWAADPANEGKTVADFYTEMSIVGPAGDPFNAGESCSVVVSGVTKQGTIQMRETATNSGIYGPVCNTKVAP